MKKVPNHYYGHFLHIVENSFTENAESNTCSGQEVVNKSFFTPTTLIIVGFVMLEDY